MARQELANRARREIPFLTLTLRQSIIGGMDILVRKLSLSTNGKSRRASTSATISKSGRTGTRSKWKSKVPHCHCNVPNASSSQQITQSTNALEQTACYATQSDDDLLQWILTDFHTQDQEVDWWNKQIETIHNPMDLQ
ncbi:hypothetical protein [Circoviridae sp.]|nr:hypothetical protein [Circoviridae sp.]UOF81918.1 hypothetical protein [Circoviridae sp.]